MTRFENSLYCDPFISENGIGIFIHLRVYLYSIHNMYFNVFLQEDACGGGCATDKQCQDWAGGDATCVCNWPAFSCGRASDKVQHDPER
jgi:hypothetical protein